MHSPLEALNGYTLAQYKASTPDQVVAMIKEAEEKAELTSETNYPKSNILLQLNDDQMRVTEMENRGFLVKPCIDTSININHESLLMYLLKQE